MFVRLFELYLNLKGVTWTEIHSELLVQAFYPIWIYPACQNVLDPHCLQPPFNEHLTFLLCWQSFRSTTLLLETFRPFFAKKKTEQNSVSAN